MLLRLNGATGDLAATTPNVATFGTSIGGDGAVAHVAGLVVDSTGRVHVAGYDETGPNEATYDFAGTPVIETFLLTTTTSNFGVPSALHGGVPGSYNGGFELLHHLSLGPLDAVVITGDTYPQPANPYGLGTLNQQHHIARFVP